MADPLIPDPCPPTSDYRSPWIATGGGRIVDVIDPPPDQVHIDDIAASLSNLARFNGHTRQEGALAMHLDGVFILGDGLATVGRVRPFFSVAQHSVLVSELVPPGLELWGLLHDAAEFVIGGIPTPVKRLAPRLVSLERGVMRAIGERFGLAGAPDYRMPRAVHAADRVALATEIRDLMPAGLPWPDLPDPDPGIIRPLDPGAAEVQFLRRFNEITGAG